MSPTDFSSDRNDNDNIKQAYLVGSIYHAGFISV